MFAQSGTKPSYLLDSAKEKTKTLTEIKTAYKDGLNYCHEGNITLAEQKFIKMLRPVLSKSLMKNVYVHIEDIKTEALDAMYHLGLIYQKNQQSFDNYSKAAAIFQYCAGFAIKYNINHEVNFIKEAFGTEAKFLASIGKDILDATHILKYQKELSAFREHIQNETSRIEKYTINQITIIADKVKEIYQSCTRFFVNNTKDKLNNPGLVQKLLNDCFKQLGPVPKNCEYAVLALGSLAGGRMTPWSDLEFAILINEDRPEYKEYFITLTKLLHIKIINFGETPLRSVGIEGLNNFKSANPTDDWFWDDILKNGFSFDGPDWHACKTPFGRQGGYKVKQKIKLANGDEKEQIIEKSDFDLILTPQQLSEFQQEQKKWFESDVYLVQGLRLVLLIDGSQKLLDDYRENIKCIEEEKIIKNRALTKLTQDIQSFSLKLGDNEEGKLIDVKKDIFRIGDRIIDDLANYYFVMADKGKPGLSAWEVLDDMQYQEILSAPGAQHLKEALSISSWLRLATYCHNQGQSESMSTYQPIMEHLNEEQKLRLLEETFYIKDTSLLHHFYYVMLKLQFLVESFCDQEDHVVAKLLLKIDDLFDNDNNTKGMVHARFLEYSNALKYMESAKAETPENLEVIENLSFLYHKTGLIEDCLNAMQKKLELIIKKYEDKPNHLDIANCYNNLGVAYADAGEYQQARNFHIQALEIQKNAYKQNLNHTDIAISYNGLGGVYSNTGYIMQAINSYKQSLDILCKVYECNLFNPDIADNCHNLGNEYLAKGKYNTAIKFYGKTLEIRLKLYEQIPNHPRIATTYNALGDCCLYIGAIEQSIENYKLALKILRKFYEQVPNHPDIADSYDNLGNGYTSKGKYDKAIKYHKKALNVRREAYKLNLNHSSIAKSYNNIGNAYSANCNNTAAMTCYEKALQIQAYEKNPKPSDISITYNNLGNEYLIKLEHDKAIKHYKYALQIQIKFHENNPSHPDIAGCYNNLGSAYLSKGEIEQAIKCHTQALIIRLEAYKQNPHHPHIADSCNNLGNAYSDKGKFEKAAKYHEQALVIRLKAYKQNPNHLDIAGSYNNLGDQYLAKGIYHMAIECYNKELKIRLNVYEKIPNFSEIANTYMGLSHAYSCQGEIEQAINFCAKALEIPCAGNINEAKENFIKALTYSNDSKLHEVSTTAAIKAILVNNEIYDKSKTEINAILKFR